MIEELRVKVGVEKEIPLVETNEQLVSEIRSQISDKLYELKQTPGKQERNTAIDELREQVIAQYCPDEDNPQLQNEAAGKYNKAMVKRILEKIEGEVIKKLLITRIKTWTGLTLANWVE